MDDRLQALLLGILLGFLFGYLTAALRSIKEEVHVVKTELDGIDECVRKCQENHEHLPKRLRDDDGFMRIPLVADISYILALSLILLGLWRMGQITDQIQEDAHDRLVSQCQAGTDSREVQREIVQHIYDLAIGSIERDPKAPPLTKEELIQYNAYVDRVNDFREDLYSKIKPSEQCEPYVEDDVVPPPTPPHPPITNSETNS